MMCEQSWDDAYLYALYRTGINLKQSILDLMEERKDNPCKKEVRHGN